MCDPDHTSRNLRALDGSQLVEERDMPIYELRCESCNHEFEELVFRRSEVEELACPKCGTKPVGVLLSSFATSGGRARQGSSTSGCGSSGSS